MLNRKIRLCYNCKIITISKNMNIAYAIYQNCTNGDGSLNKLASRDGIEAGVDVISLMTGPNSK